MWSRLRLDRSRRAMKRPDFMAHARPPSRRSAGSWCSKEVAPRLSLVSSTRNDRQTTPMPDGRQEKWRRPPRGSMPALTQDGTIGPDIRPGWPGVARAGVGPLPPTWLGWRRRTGRRVNSPPWNDANAMHALPPRRKSFDHALISSRRLIWPYGSRRDQSWLVPSWLAALKYLPLTVQNWLARALP